MKTFLLVLVLFCKTLSATKPLEIVLWHAFDGFLQEVFEEIVEDFNHNTSSYQVVAKKMGNYTEIVEKGFSAFESKTHPHILQIYEVATHTAMQSEPLFFPVDELMSKFHKKFDPDIYIDAVRSLYTNGQGQLMSLPWNASTGILFYNKDAFKASNLDPELPPTTWEEFERICPKLLEKGYYGYTTAWPAAYHLEHFCSWHNLPFEIDGTLVFNGPHQIHHLSKLVKWSQKGYFHYAGRYNERPESLFTEGKCAILLQGANRLPLLERKASFEIGVGYMPYWKQITEKPYSLNIGGSSFWVMRGFSEEAYRGVVQFFEYLSLTEVQAYWHQKTGYLPITDAAYFLTKKKGFYQKNPAAEIAVLEVIGSEQTSNTRSVRLPHYMEIREMIIDSLEKALEGELSPEDALKKATELGNNRLQSE